MAPEISAHRRDTAGHTGLRDAAATGAEYVEIDVRRAGDGHLVVQHDAAVRGRPVAELDRTRLRELSGRPVVTVPEALAVIAGRARAHLDVKEPGVGREVVELATETLGPDGFIVTTGDVALIAALKREFPGTRAALSVGRNWRDPGVVGDLAPLRALRASGADLVALNHRLARVGVLGQCARAGYPAMVWTVNAERTMRRFLHDPRVAVLVTDHPKTALRLRRA
ncbi:glycerophosphodiester phosphodiesterase [Actinomadura flavalba]|uniref:glycerophosphodiester phosphodiesterase n=1 Tax=Actinomadura flavalba TaxID=1120938 RepID=UPI000365C762|nr:glycerophosphodiester phosphodiesterase [Actinomadura flavalba]